MIVGARPIPFSIEALRLARVRLAGRAGLGKQWQQALRRAMSYYHRGGCSYNPRWHVVFVPSMTDDETHQASATTCTCQARHPCAHRALALLCDEAANLPPDVDLAPWSDTALLPPLPDTEPQRLAA